MQKLVDPKFRLRIADMFCTGTKHTVVIFGFIDDNLRSKYVS